MSKLLISLLLAFPFFLGAANNNPITADTTGVMTGNPNFFMANLTNAGVIHVAKTGNNATALRGNATRPFASVSNAVAAAQSGDTIYIWPGDYQVLAGGSPTLSAVSSNGAAVNLYNRTNISIIGIGQPRLTYSNSITIMEIRNVDGFKISGLTFDCTNKFGGSFQSNLISCINIDGSSRNGRISDCNFLNFPDHGISDDLFMGDFNQTNIWVSKCHFFNGGATNGVVSLTVDGAGIPCGSYWYITDCSFNRCLRGIEVYRGNTALIPYEQIRITGCSFHQMHYESIIIPGVLADDLIKDLVISENTFDDNSGEVSAATSCISGAGGQSRINIINNIFDFGLLTFRYNVAINFHTSAGQGKIKDCQWLGNTILSSGGNAISLADEGSTSAVATNNLIANNIIRRPVGIGIYVQGAGNRIINNTITAAFSGSGSIIVADGIGNTRNNILVDNIIEGSPTAGIYFELGASNNIARNNIIVRSVTQAISDLNPLGFNTIDVNFLNGAERRGTNELGPVGNGYPYLNQWTPVTVTNVTTATNALIVAANSDGSLIFPAGFWTRNKTVVINQNGTYWSTATPGNNRFIVNLDTTAALSNTVTHTLFAVPASQSGSAYSLEVRLMCMTNTTTGAIMAEGTLTTMNGSTPTTHTFTNAANVMNVTLQSTIGLLETNGASTTQFKSGTTTIRVQ